MTRRGGDEAGRFARFCMVGGLGFVIDAAALLALTQGLGWGPIAARIASVLVALTATWAVHRRYTFASRDPGRIAEWSRFAAVNGIGAVINFAVYSAILVIASATPPLLALAAGSAVALGANYIGARSIAFRQPATPSF